MDAATARNYVTQLYQQMLGRAPDQAGLEYWAQQLVSGMSPDQLSASISTAAQAAGEKVKVLGLIDPSLSNTTGLYSPEVVKQKEQEATDAYNKLNNTKLTVDQWRSVNRGLTGTTTSGLLKTPSVYSSGIGPDGKPFYTDPWGMKHTGVLQADGTAWFPNPTAQRSGTAELYYGFANDPTQSIASVTSPEGDKAVNANWAKQAVKQGVTLDGQVGFTVPKDQLDYLYGAMRQDRRDNEKFAVKDGWNWKDTLGLASLIYGGYNLLNGGGLFSGAGSAADIAEVPLDSLYSGSAYLNGTDLLSEVALDSLYPGSTYLNSGLSPIGTDLFSQAGLTGSDLVAGPGTNVTDWISTAAAGGDAANVATPVAGLGGWTTNLANSTQLINPTTGQIFDTVGKTFLPSIPGVGSGSSINTVFPNVTGGTTINSGTSNGTVTQAGTATGTVTPGTGTPGTGVVPAAASGVNTLLDLIRAAYGIGQGNSLKDFANAPPQAYDPFSGQRPQYQKMLQDLMTGKTGVADLPGYKAGLEAVNRGLAASGYLGSGNQMTALKDYGGQQWKDQVGILTQLAGGTLSPQVVNNSAAQIAGVQASGSAVNTGIEAISRLLGGDTAGQWLQSLIGGGGTGTQVNSAATTPLPV